MKHIILYTGVCLLFLAACTNSSQPKEEKELTQTERLYRDSVSRAEQKHVSDSLKKKNPLLILPPDSIYTGDYTDKYSSGITKFKGFFRFGKRHGQWMSFYPSGLLWSEMHYEKGLRQGPNVTYYQNGTLRYTGFYKNDIQDSIWRYYDSLGHMMKKIRYYSSRGEAEALPLEK